MNSWIIWAGSAALAVLCCAITFLPRWKIPKSYQTDEIPKLVTNPEEPMYGIKENNRNG